MISEDDDIWSLYGQIVEIKIRLTKKIFIYEIEVECVGQKTLDGHI